jgi:hypothetical protein
MIKLFKRANKKRDNIKQYLALTRDYRELSRRYEIKDLRHKVAKAELEEAREGLNVLKIELERLLDSEKQNLGGEI